MSDELEEMTDLEMLRSVKGCGAQEDTGFGIYGHDMNPALHHALKCSSCASLLVSALRDKALEAAMYAERKAYCDELKPHEWRTCTGCIKAKRAAACRAYFDAMLPPPSCGLNASLSEREQQEIPTAPTACEWIRDEFEGHYELSCSRRLWTLNDGDLKDNRIKFCMECGKPVVEVVPAPEPEDE